MQRADVIVVGLGAMGGATAYHLARLGLDVLGLDRDTPPHTLGSSHGRTRVIREAYFEDPGYVPLVQRAFTLWRELEKTSAEPLLSITGALMLGRPDSHAVQGSLRSAAEHRLSHEQLTAAEVVDRFPALRPGPEMVGLWEPGAGALLAEACVRAHLDAARAAGARLRFGQAALSWRADPGGVEVVTAAGSYAADHLVLAAGAWLPDLVGGLPLEVERQAQFWFRPAAEPELFRPDRCPVFLYELDSGQQFYGLPDFGDGVKAARHRGGERTTPAAVRREVTAADDAPVRAFLGRYLPHAAGQLLRSSVCLYTNTPSHDFLIDLHPEHARVWLVSPCSGHGFKFAPAIGERVAHWVASGERGAGLDGFRLDAVARA